MLSFFTTYEYLVSFFQFRYSVICAAKLNICLCCFFHVFMFLCIQSICTLALSDEQEKDIKTMGKVNYGLFMGANAMQVVNGKRQNNNQCVSSLNIEEKITTFHSRYVVQLCHEPDGLTFFSWNKEIKKTERNSEYNQF